VKRIRNKSFFLCGFVHLNTVLREIEVREVLKDEIEVERRERERKEKESLKKEKKS
jgi:hypothetical protein